MQEQAPPHGKKMPAFCLWMWSQRREFFPQRFQWLCLCSSMCTPVISIYVTLTALFWCRTTLESLWGAMCFWLSKHRLEGGKQFLLSVCPLASLMWPASGHASVQIRVPPSNLFPPSSKSFFHTFSLPSILLSSSTLNGCRRWAHCPCNHPDPTRRAGKELSDGL